MNDFKYYFKKVGFFDTLFSMGFWSIIIYRFGRFIYKQPLRKINPLWYFYLLIRNIFLWISKIELPPTCQIGQNLFLPHPYGVVMGNKVCIGNNCTIGPWVVIGHNGNANEQPVINDDVYIGAHACILGNVIIEKNVLIGVNAVVTKNVPSNCIVKPIFEIVNKKTNENTSTY